MKKVALRIIEAIAMVFVLSYLTKVSLELFPKLLKTFPVEFIVYKPTLHVTMIQTAFWSAIAISTLAVAIEWKRENRKVSYLVFLAYFFSPFVASVILWLITAAKVSKLPDFQTEVSTDIIPMALIFIGYALFPLTHTILKLVKGRSSRSYQHLSRSALQVR